MVLYTVLKRLSYYLLILIKSNSNSRVCEFVNSALKVLHLLKIALLISWGEKRGLIHNVLQYDLSLRFILKKLQFFLRYTQTYQQDLCFLY